MNRKDEGYVWPIAIALLYILVARNGYVSMKNGNILILVLMLQSFVGLMRNILRKGDYIWKGEGKIISLITGVMILFFSLISTINYYYEGTKYLGGTLSLILLGSFTFMFIKKADRKEHLASYISMIVVLVVYIAVTAYRTIYFPKNEVAFHV